MTLAWYSLRAAWTSSDPATATEPCRRVLLVGRFGRRSRGITGGQDRLGPVNVSPLGFEERPELAIDGEALLVEAGGAGLLPLVVALHPPEHGGREVPSAPTAPETTMAVCAVSRLRTLGRSLKPQVAERLLHILGQLAVHAAAATEAEVLDPPAPLLVAEDVGERLPISADAAVELGEGEAARGLRLPAAALLLHVGEPEGFGVSLTAAALALGGGGDCGLPPGGVSGASASVVGLGHRPRF